MSRANQYTVNRFGYDISDRGNRTRIDPNLFGQATFMNIRKESKKRRRS